MLPPRVTWAVLDDGLNVYRNGELVAVIGLSSFGNLIFELVKKLREKLAG